jgi:Cd2+/Zn2+-exporting ATPase
MLFFQIGELFEGYAEGKSRESIAHLMDIRPDVAHLEGEKEGRREGVEDVTPDEVAVGSVIVIRPGEKVPLDGVVIEGSSALNTVALTGESLPRDVNVDDEVISGCVNLSGVLRVRTTKAFGESTVSKIISLVENAGERKSQSETFITRFARIYTPIVVFLALALAIIPTLFGGSFATWLYRALMFLVVSCPCALVISVPLTFFGGIGGASRKGILIKGANFMDVLAKVDTVAFDKTGTLTHGQFAVEAVHPDTCDEHQLLHLAAHVEHFSTHPIGAALRDAFPDEATDGCQVSDVEEIAGHGIRARVKMFNGPLGRRTLATNGTQEWSMVNENITRTQAGIRLAVEEHPDALFVFGNAPTALMELCDLIRKGKAHPAGIIAAPVGFVHVKESKHMVKPFKDIPKIIVEGRKGGSNLAATLCNAILTFDDAAQLKPGRDL